jgi:hypothetical protein
MSAWLLVLVAVLFVWIVVQIEQLHRSLISLRSTVMNGFTNLIAAVQQEETVQAGAIVALNGVVAEVEALKGQAVTDEQLQGLADRLTAATSPLAAAIAAVPAGDVLGSGGTSNAPVGAAPAGSSASGGAQPSPTSGPATIPGTGGS